MSERILSLSKSTYDGGRLWRKFGKERDTKMAIDTFKFIDQHGSLNKINRGELDELWNSLRAKHRVIRSQNSFILLERSSEHAVKVYLTHIRIMTTVASRLCPWAEDL